VRTSSQIVTLVVKGERHKVELPLAGEFQVLNAVSALGLAMVTGVEKDIALEALENLHGVAGRMERAGQTKEGAPIFVDFAHTEDGRPKMGKIAAKLADDVIVTDDNPRTEEAATIRKAVLSGCPEATEIGDRAKAIREGIKRLGPKDCLVIAGKGHEQGQIVGTQVIPFSDVEQVKLALKELGHV